jgi:hypothetical protein
VKIARQFIGGNKVKFGEKYGEIEEMVNKKQELQRQLPSQAGAWDGEVNG